MEGLDQVAWHHSLQRILQARLGQRAGSPQVQHIRRSAPLLACSKGAPRYLYDVHGNVRSQLKRRSCGIRSHLVVSTKYSLQDSISDFNKGLAFLSLTAWNDKEGATQQITESKPFEAFCLLGAVVATADLE